MLRLVWLAEYEGNAPSPRFGCSCVPIPSVSTSDYSTTNRYIVTGGSDGSDLCRDGDELTDVSILHITYPCNRFTCWFSCLF